MVEKSETLPFLGDFISGDFFKPAQSNGNFDSINPANLKDTVLRCTYQFDRVNAACSAAHKAFRPWADLPPNERKNYISKLKESFIQHAEELASTITREMGKPLWEARGEVKALIKNIDAHLNYCVDLVKTWEVPEASRRAQGRVYFKPRGVMAVIGPFNFPAYVPMEHVIPALLTGNTVVFKPSEAAPAVGQILAQLFEKSKFPPGVFNLVQGPSDTGKRLVMHEQIEGVLFTGSYETGFKIRQDILPHFWKIAALEMGGKNAAIVFDDADAERALQENIKGAYVTSGQRCTSTSRIILMRSIAEKFIDRFHAAAKGLVVGPGHADPFMGPLINGSAVDKYLRFQGIATRENSTQIMRGKILELETPGFFVTPSINVVTKVDPNSVYQKTEIFGPNVAFYIVDDADQALDILNNSSYGLSMSVFSKQRENFEYCRSRARVGVANWNLSTVSTSAHLPFGGMGKSGNNNPTGSFAVFYCTYPVASLEDDSTIYQGKRLPGFDLGKE